MIIQKDNDMTSIAVLEDDSCIERFITNGLRAENYQVQSFSVINELVNALQEQDFSILIMDRMIGSIDALTWVRTFKLLKPEIKVLTLSALAGSIQRISGLENGSDDYLEKPFEYRELSLRIKKLNSKDSGGRENIICYDDITLEVESNKMQRSGRTINLTHCELLMMLLFLENPNKVFSRAELLDQVWGYSHDTCSNVVDVAIGKLRKKINLGSCTQLICSSRGVGYSLSRTET